MNIQTPDGFVGDTGGFFHQIPFGGGAAFRGVQGLAFNAQLPHHVDQGAGLVQHVLHGGIAFGADQAGKEKALSNFSLEDLADVFRKGTAVQQQAIKDAVSGSAVVNKIDIFANAKNELAGTSPAMNDMRTKLGI